MTDNGIKQIVAELDDLRYTAAEIGLVLRISERRVGRILQDVKPRPPRLRTIDDLPQHMRDRVRECVNERAKVQILNPPTAQTG